MNNLNNIKNIKMKMKFFFMKKIFIIKQFKNKNYYFFYFILKI